MVTYRNKIGFSAKNVCEIADISLRKLHYWTNAKLVQASASGRHKGREEFRYNLRDILVVLVIKELRNKGLSLQRIIKSVKNVKDAWGGDHHLARLRVACLPQSVVLKKDGVYVDALTGQQVMEGALEKIRNNIKPKRWRQTERMVDRIKEGFALKANGVITQEKASPEEKHLQEKEKVAYVKFSV